MGYFKLYELGIKNEKVKSQFSIRVSFGDVCDHSPQVDDTVVDILASLIVIQVEIYFGGKIFIVEIDYILIPVETKVVKLFG